MENKKNIRVMCMVPNGATSDNRVVREAESLNRAGYEVLLVGLRLTNFPGAHAITPGGVHVRRIDWRYNAYLKVILTYLGLILPFAAVISLAFAFIGVKLYFDYLFPIALDFFNQMTAVLSGGWSLVFGLLPSESSPFLKKEVLGRGDSAVLSVSQWWHVAVLGFYYVAFLFLRKFLGVSRLSSYFSNFLQPITKPIARSLRAARFYGEAEGSKDTFLDRLLSSNNSMFRNMHDFISQRYISGARTKGFVIVGEDFRPDIIQCHEIGCLPAAIQLKKKLNCKIVYEAHEIYDDLANASASMSRQNRKIHADCLGVVDGFVTVNEHIGAFYKEKYTALPEATIVPNSVFPSPPVEYDGRLHEAAKLPLDAKILLYQGGFSPNRGLEVLLEAAYEMPDDWYVVFMGKGPLGDLLQEKADQFFKMHQTKLRDKLRVELLASGRIIEGSKLSVFMHGMSDREGSPAVVEAESVLVSTQLTNSEVELDEVFGKLHEFRKKELLLRIDDQIQGHLAEYDKSGLMKKARFIPMAAHSELVAWTSGASIGIIPYENVGLNHWYCSPNKIWEYPNAGVPILASRLSYLSEIINNWSIGWTISSDPKPQDIVATVRSISDSELADKVLKCREFIRQSNYDLHEPNLLALFKSLTRD